jgi:hypothetical protein
MATSDLPLILGALAPVLLAVAAVVRAWRSSIAPPAEPELVVDEPGHLE